MTDITNPIDRAIANAEADAQRHDAQHEMFDDPDFGPGAPPVSPTVSPTQMTHWKSPIAEEPPLPAIAPEIPDTVDVLLTSILSRRRQHGTQGDLSFRADLCKSIMEMGFAPMQKEFNLVCVVPRPGDEYPHVLFSCHIDTCHSGKPGEHLQRVAYDRNFGHIFLEKDDTVHGNVLGADDGVGVWIMLRMIEEKVPGVYVFHVGEEVGCIGSGNLARKEPEWLKKFKIAVAFDRPNTYEVITHQRAGTRMASDTCGQALAKALNDAGKGQLAYRTSDRGVVTDTAQYAYLIPECFNLGVGYWDQHGPRETLDYGHAFALMKACITLDWHALPIERVPAKPPTYGGYGGYGGGGHYGRSQLNRDLDERDRNPPSGKRGKKNRIRKVVDNQAPVRHDKGAQPTEPSTRAILAAMSFEDIEEWVQEDPQAAAFAIVELLGDIEGVERKLAFVRAVWAR